jgi:hypothetical protein
MKKSKLLLFVIVVIGLSVNSMKPSLMGSEIVNVFTDKQASPCPGPYDIYNSSLNSVYCLDKYGNPRTDTYLDCVAHLYYCCNTDDQTPCSEPTI